MFINHYTATTPSSIIDSPSSLLVISHGAQQCSIEHGRMGQAGVEKTTVNTSGNVGMGVVHTSLPVSGEASTEVWSIASGDAVTVESGQSGSVSWRKTPEFICVAAVLNQQQCQLMEASVERSYLDILNCLNELGYAKPFRYWNYLPAINQGEGDSEVYRLFCSGRLKAFESHGIASDQFPAASALGHHSEDALIYVFASRTAQLIHHKNRRQVNAYEYPRCYGPSEPSFARATTLKGQQYASYYISGTASILGHESVFVDDLSGQLETIAANMTHLLEEANPEQCQLATAKVYIRHRSDFACVQQWFEQTFPNVQALYAHADICRSELLVEIEAYCR